MKSLLFSLLSLCLLAGCKKDGLRQNKKLLRGDWHMTEMYIRDDSSLTGNYITISQCMDDDFTTFERNGSCSMNAGPVTCNKNEPHITYYDWELTGAKTLQLTSRDDHSVSTYEITELSSNTLKMTSTAGNGIVTLTAYLTYVRR